MPVICAQISKDGDCLIPNKYIEESNRLPNAQFQIKFKRGTFREAPAVTATVIAKDRSCGRGGSSRFLSVTHLTESEVCLATFRASERGGSVARDFNLLVAGK